MRKATLQLCSPKKVALPPSPLNSEYLSHTQVILAKYHLSSLVSVGLILEIEFSSIIS